MVPGAGSNTQSRLAFLASTLLQVTATMASTADMLTIGPQQLGHQQPGLQLHMGMWLMVMPRLQWQQAQADH